MTRTIGLFSVVTWRPILFYLTAAVFARSVIFRFGSHTMPGKKRWRLNHWLHRLLGRSERQDGGTFNPRRVERHSVLLGIEGLL